MSPLFVKLIQRFFELCLKRLINLTKKVKDPPLKFTKNLVF
jgi:hypothetical protein